MQNPTDGIALLTGIAVDGAFRAVALVAPWLPRPIGKLVDEATGQALSMTLVSCGTSTPLGAALARRGVEVFHIEASATVAGRSYRLDVTAGTTTATVRTRALPRAGAESLTLLAATCFYLHARKQDAYRAAALSTRLGDADLNILAGDNLYMDVAPDQRALRDPWEETAERYATYFRDPNYVAITSARPTITTWDDHELWNNYPELQIHLSRTFPWNYAGYEAAAQEAISAFQQGLNPPAVTSGGRSYVVNSGPVSIFVADTRSRRTRLAAPQPSFLPSSELLALEGWVRTLDRPGVLVVGQPLWLERGHSLTDCTLANFPTDYRRVLDAIAKAPFDVLVVSGDVHHSRVLSLYVGDAQVHEIVTSAAVRIPSASSIALGNYRGQADAHVEIDRSVETDADGMGKPALGRYHFGCEVPNTFALISLRRASASGDCDVGVTFVDSDTGLPAGNVQPKNGLPSMVDRSRYDVCHDDTLLVLRRR